ncbi:ganglioside GM2 activator [Aplysia californica]|uniref:Ganglioside GM2 activator n=1 Tax=Aplysia californica TaxID=6500 RepID=A0ABM0K7H8_APLCA|nr:ganglioside GM2 activator [Aplysia californica]
MRCFALVLTLVILSVDRSDQKDILRFQAEEKPREVETLFDLLTGRMGLMGRSSRVGAFKYTNCGDPNTDLANLKDLTLSPDPLTFPGPLNVQFDADIKSTVDAPLKGVVVIETKIGSTWLKIPCIGNIGSCTYDDICELLQGITCPQPFVSAGIPCQCPFSQGSYALPKTTFDIEAAIFPPGDYHATANLTYGGSRVACVDIYASFD